MIRHEIGMRIHSELLELYGIEEKFGSSNLLYKYLFIRCGIKIGRKKVENKDIINLILEDLNIDSFSDDENPLPYVIYNNEKCSNFDWGNSFIENLKFRADLEGDLKINDSIENIYRKGYGKAIKYRGLKNYNKYIKYNRLLVLNEHFNISVENSMDVSGFHTSSNHNPYKRTLEENLEGKLQADHVLETKTTSYITEEQFESYLIDNLELIEEDLVYLGRQIDVPGGTVDILARDKDERLVVIEVKTSEDKAIVWQALYYPDEIRKKYNTDSVRMITIAPHYSKYLLSVLKRFEEIEIFNYEITVEKREIKELFVSEI